MARRVLAGQRGPVRDAVLLSAAAALTAVAPAAGPDGAEPLPVLLGAGVARAAAAIDSGAAARVLEEWVRRSGVYASAG